MIPLDSPIWKELDSSGSDTYEVFHNLMEGKGDFREDMEFLGEDLSCQFCYYETTAYVLPTWPFCVQDSLWKIRHF